MITDFELKTPTVFIFYSVINEILDSSITPPNNLPFILLLIFIKLIVILKEESEKISGQTLTKQFISYKCQI